MNNGSFVPEQAMKDLDREIQRTGGMMMRSSDPEYQSNMALAISNLYRARALNMLAAVIEGGLMEYFRRQSRTERDLT